MMMMHMGLLGGSNWLQRSREKLAEKRTAYENNVVASRGGELAEGNAWTYGSDGTRSQISVEEKKKQDSRVFGRTNDKNEEKFNSTNTRLQYGSASNPYSGSSGLQYVSDPNKAYADITRGEYTDFKNNYGGFETDLIKQAQTDTRLVDQARLDSEQATELMSEVADRSNSRYGAHLTPAQREQQSRALTRGTTLGTVQSVNDARITQKEINQRTISDLINIGQGVNRSSQSQMGQAAADASARKNAYTQAKAAHKAQTYSTIGSLAGSAIMAFAFLSDARAKQNIKKVGTSAKGINIYEYSYIGNKDRYQGVMANEVPWAVIKREGDFDLVDYSKVDVELKKVA